jgi:OOP family OmpA-OmpF porin
LWQQQLSGNTPKSKPITLTMASKKYSMAVGLLLLAASSAFAQEGTAYDWRDSSKIPSKRMPQQNEFLNNQYAFPAKPRDQWELGLSAGHMMIIGSIPSKPGFGGGISLRKSLGHTFSIRAEYTGSYAYGLDYRPRTGTSLGGIWASAYGNGPVYANYRTQTHMLSIDGIVTLNNIKFYSDKVKTNWYLLGGYTLLAAQVDVNAVPKGGGTYDFASIDPNESRSNVHTQIKDLIGSGNYNQLGPNGGNRPPIGNLNGYQVRHSLDIGAGFAYKINRNWNIGIEDKIIDAFDPYLDGVYGVGRNDFFNYTDLRLNFAIGSKSKRVEPLWWWNPLDYAYNELNAPKHMKIPTPILPDADGDGVTDQFDREPNTPAGCPVDSHGVSRDTDGDGVPDCKDKELITPTICQPVDADGVGKCPDPACCKNIQPVAAPTCALGSLPSITYKGKSAEISSSAKSLLADVAAQLRNNPNCKVTLAGHPGASKVLQALNQKRVDAIKNYLIEKEGIGSDRIVPQYDGGEGDIHTIDLRTGL